MKLLLSLLVAILVTISLFDTPTQADEKSRSLLEQLDRETARLTKTADGALVHIKTVHGWQRGVLAGSGPYLVAGYSPGVKGRDVEFLLADGTRGMAKRIDGDAELGVTVYSLPPKVAGKHAGIEVERSWSVGRGHLAVFGGPLPGLTAVTKTDRLRGRLHAATEANAPVLLSASGRLLGLRPPTVMSQSCTACHVRNDLRSTSSFVNLNLATQVRDIVWVADAAGLLRSHATWAQPSRDVALVDLATLYVGKKDYVAPRVEALRALSNHPPIHTASPATEYIAGPVIARVLEDIEAHGRIRRAYLGAVPSDTKKGAKPRGVVLSAVIQGSPVEQAGLKKGDVITAVNGVPTKNAWAFTRTLVHARPGDVLELSLANEELRVRVALADRREAAKRIITPGQTGFSAQALDPSLRKYLALKADAVGVVVTSVNAKSAAQTSGLRRGDVIIAGSDGAIRDVGELEAELAGSCSQCPLVILRGGKEQTIVLALKLGGERNRPR